eukprot:CAMPEP_0176095526 /NCGR_PEP_ID=MMETSP0120_2-20121206/47880_1 /TAXON_ID=160619 /ORGANISM="Kryptoperidinium foliaceum, Strain CCMP 1326" /LENGTH=449 /DNA_ID=CAMNT_0017429493 /DNA_START=86 /DNA_END=1435 /DNA_ORIENTATION=+
MLDLGLLMYGGLLILALWRCLCFYRCCGLWLSFLNYTSLLYLILTASLVYSAVEFYERLKDPLISHPDAQVWNIHWLRPFVCGSPIAVICAVVLCWFQTEGHVFEIHKDIGMLKHDRAVQIIALPSVFAVMALASMVPLLELVTGNISEEMLNTPFGVDIRSRLGKLNVQSSMKDDLVQIANATATAAGQGGTMGWDKSITLAMWRYETCFYVGDLFEAWALYQFGLLALDLIRESFENQLKSESEAERSAARECLATLSAVSKLAWLGTMSFVIVCVGQTACAMSPYIMGTSSLNGSDTILLGFQVAGFIASSVALYNVFVVEYTFHRYLDRSSPLLKFLSVKILVSLSFFQRGLLVILQGGNKLLPEVVQRIVAYVPLFGDIINMTEVQLHLFYPACILYECFLTTCLHFWAWNANEAWYFHPELGDVETEPVERTPLIPKHIMANV